jgi:hypothetical protein
MEVDFGVAVADSARTFPMKVLSDSCGRAFGADGA